MSGFGCCRKSNRISLPDIGKTAQTYTADRTPDIKPTNIMLQGDFKKGQGIVSVYLIDFNTARVFDAERNRDTELIGTRGFAAPEQYGFSQSDARTDIYGLGVLLNYMLCGKFDPGWI